MGTREELNALLCEILGSDHVYYQPPENLKIVYPCIVYSLNTFLTRYANNNTYHRRRRYDLIYISREPDEEIVETLANLPYCSLDKVYTSDNLYHYPYTIYY